MANILKFFTKSVKNWYIPLIVGILFIIFGIYILTVPANTYITLSILFSIAFILSGAGDVVFSILNSKVLDGWGWQLVSGLLMLIIGIYLLTSPTVSMAILPFVVGFTLLFRSFNMLGFSLHLRSLGLLRWGNLAIYSVLGIVFSLFLIINPLFSGVSLVLITAIAFIINGIGYIQISLYLKKIKDFPKKIGENTKIKIEEIENEIDEAMDL